MRAATGAVRRAVCGNIRATRAVWKADIVVIEWGHLQTWGAGLESCWDLA